MFNTVGITRGLTFSKVLGGLSKTLQIANQVIPLYQRAKPVISNARSIFNVVKGFSKSNSKTIEAKDAIVVNTKTINPNNIKKLTKRLVGII